MDVKRLLHAGLMLLGLWAVGVAQAQMTPPKSAAEMAPYWDASCSCYRSVPWGTERWVEPSLNREVGQVFDLWIPATRPERPMPLIIWAHASGKDHVIVAKDAVHKGIVVPALAAGMAVMTIEHRHPVLNANLGAVYHDDVLRATQFIRSLSSQLYIDGSNLFFAGRGRGSLGVWSGLQNSAINPAGGWLERQSTRFNAVFAIEAQTTYRPEENALYLVEPDRAAYLAANPSNPAYGSAVASATADDPPVMMRYSTAFFRRLVTRTEFKQIHPDHALTLCSQYLAVGNRNECVAQDLVPSANLFDGIVPFFQKYLKQPPRNAAEIAPYLDASCNCYRNVPWGPERWYEIPLAREVGQVFELWMPNPRPPGPMPVIVWAHASGKDHVILARDSVHKGIVVPALAAGMAVVSVEFRHPVNNNYLDTVHHDDLIQVLQYLRTLAPAMNFDANNFFFAGRSRGSLGIWSAVQNERADPLGNLAQQQSSRVNAVFAIEAQTTYRSEENALYLVESQRAGYLAANPPNPLYGSAVADATADDPPVLMRYPLPFFNRLVNRNELKPHHPDYGLTLCSKYTSLGIGARCTAQDQVAAENLFLDVIPFFQSNLR